jgi:capsular exopolysaccharide synthesis family protein
MSHIHEALLRGGANGSPAERALEEASQSVDVPWDIDTSAAQAPEPASTESHPEAQFPDARSFDTHVDRHGSYTADRLVIGTATPQSIEQYRRISAVLHLTQMERGTKIVMVASALPGEGKTLTASNVALTLSESYHRSVLLVDADLRRPTIHQVFGIPNVSGLNDGLRPREERKLSIIQQSPYLSILTAGRPDPDPMSGLSSERMRQMLMEASARFDWVLLDTPPIGLLPDAHLLSSMVDGIVLVVRAGMTPYGPIRRAIDALGRDRILGVVLNRVVDRRDEYGRDYYAYSHYAPTNGEPKGEVVR